MKEQRSSPQFRVRRWSCHTAGDNLVQLRTLHSDLMRERERCTHQAD